MRRHRQYLNPIAHLIATHHNHILDATIDASYGEARCVAINNLLPNI
ncbi:hypothetical protein QT970_16770 [Microcoleus sp. herbarium8]